jgi:hypothetical protein
MSIFGGERRVVGPSTSTLATFGAEQSPRSRKVRALLRTIDPLVEHSEQISAGDVEDIDDGEVGANRGR